MDARRIFAAIDVGTRVRSKVSAYSEELRRKFADVKGRWERPEKFHITLRFAAKADVALTTHIIELIEAAATVMAPFDLIVCDTGAFTQRRGPGVLWIGAKAESDGTDLLKNLRNKLFDAGEMEKRKFHPHITIARLKDPVRARGLLTEHRMREFSPIVTRVEDLVLYESRLESSGSVYTEILRQPLSGTG